MRTALDAPVEILDEAERQFVASVREHGWFGTHVFADDDNPGFSFTTGRWLHTGQPELILFAFRNDIAQDVFWELYRNAVSGTPLPVGEPSDQAFANLPSYAFPVAKRFYPEYLGWSRWFYGNDDFPCQQIVWPDRDGVFPWQDGFDPNFIGLQPDLTDAGWVAAIRR